MKIGRVAPSMIFWPTDSHNGASAATAHIPGAAAEVDLEALDTFLRSDDSLEESMMLPGLDGFLTGNVVGPEPILPSE